VGLRDRACKACLGASFRLALRNGGNRERQFGVRGASQFAEAEAVVAFVCAK
jgi:hypothetical protein